MTAFKYILSILMMCILINTTTSQTDSTKKRQPSLIAGIAGEDWGWRLKCGGGFNESWEVGIIRCTVDGPPFGMLSYGLSNEFVYDGRLFNPKIHAEVSYLFAGARISLIDYNNFIKHELRLRPEIGFSAGGMMTLFFGHDFKLRNQDYNTVPINRWHFSLHLML
jgi:hypothetical protein